MTEVCTGLDNTYLVFPISVLHLENNAYNMYIYKTYKSATVDKSTPYEFSPSAAVLSMSFRFVRL